MIYLDLSPYTLSALRFKNGFGIGTEWMEPHYVPSRILRTLGFDYPPLVGLPMAVFADLARALKYLRNSFHRKPSQFENGGKEPAGKR